MIKVISKKENEYANVIFSDGKRLLISIAGQPYPSIKFLKMIFFGIIPYKTLWTLDSKATGSMENYVNQIISNLEIDTSNDEAPLDAFIRHAEKHETLEGYLKDIQDRFN